MVQGQGDCPAGSAVYPPVNVRNPAAVVRLVGLSSAISDRGEQRWLLTASGFTSSG